MREGTYRCSRDGLMDSTMRLIPFRVGDKLLALCPECLARMTFVSPLLLPAYRQTMETAELLTSVQKEGDDNVEV